LAGAALVISMSLAACSGTSSPSVAPVKPKPSGSKIVLDSVQVTTAARSARIAMTMSSPGALGLSASLSGVTDFATGNSQLTFHVGGSVMGALEGGLVERTVDNVIYVEFPPSLEGTFGLPAGARWLAMPLPDAGSTAPSLFPGLGPSDPTQLLAYLEAVSSDVTTVGPDTVRGVETTHYHALLDLQKALDRGVDQNKVPASLRKSLKQILSTIAGPGSTIPVDLWIDSDGRVRRVTEHLDFSALGAALGGPSGATGSSGSDGSSVMTTSMDFYDFGVPVNVQAPPADQVTKFPSLGDLGNLGGASGASGAAS
jgi:hypothetical protein